MTNKNKQKILTIVILYAYIVVDEVQVVPGSDSHDARSPFAESVVSLMECLVNVDKSIHNCLSVSGSLLHLHVHWWEHLRTDVLEEQVKRLKI